MREAGAAPLAGQDEGARAAARFEALRRTGPGLLLAAAVVAALVAPWTLRNYQAFGRPVLLNTNAGYAFFWGNHPVHGDRFVAILPSGQYQRLIPAELRALDEAALDQALLREGVRFVAADPQRYLRLSLNRLEDYFQFWPSTGSGALSNVVRVASFGACLPLIVGGLWLAARRRGRVIATGQGPAVGLLVLFAAVYSLIHLLSWTLVRYRLPVDAVLLPFAALALVQVAEAAGRLRRAVARPLLRARPLVAGEAQ
jgi:hypothetical protein